MRLSHSYQDEASSDEGGGGGGGDGGSGDGKPDPMVALEMVGKQVSALNQAVALMARSQQESQTRMQELTESLSKGRKVDNEGEDKGGSGTGALFEGVDLEQLDRTQFGTLLVSKFMERLDAHLDGKLKPVSDEINGVKTTLTQNLSKQAIGEVASGNKDLYEWKDEISTILKETPGLPLVRALTIARSENPKKAAEMVKKYSGSDGGKSGNQYLSLTPTSRTGGSDAKGGKMKFHEAAENAFDDVVASFGGSSFDQLMKQH